MDIPQNILSVKIGDELYGFDGNKVAQILRIPTITDMPLASAGLKGVSSISGKVVTMIDMGVVLGTSEVDHTNKMARVLTITCDGNEYGLLVDEVVGMSSVEEENYELTHDANDKIEAIYKTKDNICQVVNACNAINTLFLLNYTPVAIDRFEQKENINNQDQNVSNENQRFLFLTLGNEEFSISLDIAREIIFVPQNITPMSEAGYGVIGMITLRDELIVAIDLKELLGIYSHSEIEEKNQRLLILNHKGKSLALKVDSISEVKDIPVNQIETLPQKFRDNKIDSIYKAKSNIVSIISKRYLIDILDEYSVDEGDVSHISNNNEDDKQESEEMIEVAVFQIANEEFALGIEDVQEIIKYTEITPIPEAPAYVDGVINLRGVVIPIISLPERLGFEKNINAKSKILVCVIGNERIGLLVDDVNEIMFIEDQYISKSTSEDALFSDIITLDDGKRVILKMKLTNVIPSETLENINISQ